jgi:hypothetical protein
MGLPQRSHQLRRLQDDRFGHGCLPCDQMYLLVAKAQMAVAKMQMPHRRAMGTRLSRPGRPRLTCVRPTGSEMTSNHSFMALPFHWLVYYTWRRRHPGWTRILGQICDSCSRALIHRPCRDECLLPGPSRSLCDGASQQNDRAHGEGGHENHHPHQQHGFAEAPPQVQSHNSVRPFGNRQFPYLSSLGFS